MTTPNKGWPDFCTATPEAVERDRGPTRLRDGGRDAPGVIPAAALKNGLGLMLNASAIRMFHGRHATPGTA
jgi:hypothetical protein